MIKLSELIPGETILIDSEKTKVLVLEVGKNTAVLSEDDAFEIVGVQFTEKQLNEYFTLYTEPSKIPEQTDCTKLPKVRFRDNEEDDWRFGYFLMRDDANQNSFLITSSAFSIKWTKFCEYYEWED